MTHPDPNETDDDREHRQLVLWSIANVPATLDEVPPADADQVPEAALSEDEVRRVLAMALGLAPLRDPPRYLPPIRDGRRQQAFRRPLFVFLVLATIGAVVAILVRIHWPRGRPEVLPIPPVKTTDEWLIDDADPDFHIIGPSWGTSAVGGFRGSHHYNVKGSLTALWEFTDLTPGRYDVFLTWSRHENRAYEAPFRVLDDDRELATVIVDQSLVPTDLSYEGAMWLHLGEFQITSGSLIVELSAHRSKVRPGAKEGASASADAVLVRRVPAPTENKRPD